MSNITQLKSKLSSHKRVDLFAENMRDGVEFEPSHVQAHPEYDGKYRILDGAHRRKAHQAMGAKEIIAKVIRLNGRVPLLYAAQKAISPKQLSEDDARIGILAELRSEKRFHNASSS